MDYLHNRRRISCWCIAHNPTKVKVYVTLKIKNENKELTLVHHCMKYERFFKLIPHQSSEGVGHVETLHLSFWNSWLAGKAIAENEKKEIINMWFMVDIVNHSHSGFNTSVKVSMISFDLKIHCFWTKVILSFFRHLHFKKYL